MNPDDLDLTIGRILVDARDKAGLTQIQAAERIGISQPGLAHWESGNRSIRVTDLPKIAHAYGIHPLRLLRKIFENPKNKA